MRKLTIILIVLFLGINLITKADEGMWIPLLLEKLNIEDMQEKGFKLSAEDVYSVNKACINDGIVIFGRGCTGELVSDQGLLLTNFHCGRGDIQKLSSIENDYLTNGFWAMSKQEEIPSPGLTVKFLKSIEDVTEKVIKNVTNELSEEERQLIISLNIEEIENEARKETNYISSVKPFFYGNQYYLFLYEEYKDVRLVGNPPSSIGNFGGDTDNWTWPRHTGDFSIFRVYADKDNKPAEYAPDNVPYQPKKVLSISTKGVKEGDFTWVMGYPGSTYQFLTSDAIKTIQYISNPNNINLRGKRLDIIRRYEENNDTIRLKYAAKKYRISNSWKRWKGEVLGLKRLNTVEKKLKKEAAFKAWAEQNQKDEYIEVIDHLSSVYHELEKYSIARDYWRESIRATEVIYFVSKFNNLISMINEGVGSEEVDKEKQHLESEIIKFFKDYVVEIDRDVFKEIIPLYFRDVNEEFQPKIEDLEFHNIEGFGNNLFANSIFVKEQELSNLLKNLNKDNVNQLVNDPVYSFYNKFAQIYYNEVKPKYDSLNHVTKRLYRIYVRGLQEMYPEKVFYPDANSTMRVAYGNVAGYEPYDAVKYNYYTTLDGVIAKVNPDIYDYDVPDKLKELYKDKDFGEYQVDGTVPVCFIATNHTTGGNSGSPVFDAEGNLIGLNFDRAWNGIMSDLEFDPTQSRNITLDIRYLLFIVDKYAGAHHLIDEMNIIK